MTPRERVLQELAATLRGPRRARERLLDEIAEDLKDAIQAERARGIAQDAAEAVVAARFGTPTVVANLWNSEQTQQRRAMRRNLLIGMVALATAGALGITQYASGKSSSPPKQCTPASSHAGSRCDQTRPPRAGVGGRR